MSDKVMQHCFDDIGTLEQMKADLDEFYENNKKDKMIELIEDAMITIDETITGFDIPHTDEELKHQLRMAYNELNEAIKIRRKEND